MYDDMYKEMYGEKDEQNWWITLPIAFLVSIVPLIVYGKPMEFSGEYFKYWNGMSRGVDFFSYYKSMWIIIGTLISLLIFIVKAFSKNIKIRKQVIYIPVIVYSVLIILSTIFSEFSQISLWGFVERYEGMLVLLCYLIILFLTINMVTNESSIKTVLIALICSAVVIGLIGIMQYFGYDIYKSMSGKKLILPKNLQNMASSLKFQFADKIIYSSLYHYNYVGSYMAMLFPLNFTFFLLVRNKVYKIFFALVSLLMFLNLMLCHSRAGIIGGMVAMLVLIINLRKYLVKRWKMSIAILLIAVMGGIGFNIYSKGMLKERIGSLFKDAENLTKNINSYTLKDVTAKNNTLQITFSDKILKVESKSGNLTFYDFENRAIDTTIDRQSGQVIFKNDKFKDFNINIKDYSTSDDKKSTLEISRESLKMPFLLYNDHFTFINEKGESIELKPIEKWGFEGKEKLGSARAYIWSRSIPLLKHTIILGYGPDTFAAKFPQDDYIGKIIAYDKSSMLVDKAHNLYLEIGINIGVLGLISFLVMILIYIINCFKLYLKNDFKDFYSIVGMSIFVAICGYLGAGIFNDSVVSVAPVFWILLGIGISVNYRLADDKRKRDESKV